MEEIAPHYDFTAAWRPLAIELAQVPGDVAEFGVYNGGSTRILSRLFPDRTVWAFDTYEGMPGPEYDPAIDQDVPGSFVPRYTVKQMFDEFPNVIPVKGRFGEVLECLPLRPKIAFAYVDSDLYASTEGAMWWLQSHLVPGGIVFLDDYKTHAGVRKAVDSFVLRWKAFFDGAHVIRWRPNGS